MNKRTLLKEGQEKKSILSALSVGDKFRLKEILVASVNSFPKQISPMKFPGVFTVVKKNNTSLLVNYENGQGVVLKFASSGKHWRSEYKNGVVILVDGTNAINEAENNVQDTFMTKWNSLMKFNSETNKLRQKFLSNLDKYSPEQIQKISKKLEDQSNAFVQGMNELASLKK